MLERMTDKAETSDDNLATSRRKRPQPQCVAMFSRKEQTKHAPRSASILSVQYCAHAALEYRYFTFTAINRNFTPCLKASKSG